jgi:hypothetical protein
MNMSRIVRLTLSPGAASAKGKLLVWGVTPCGVRDREGLALFATGNAVALDDGVRRKPVFPCMAVGLLSLAVIALGSAAQADIVSATYDAGLSSPNSDSGVFPSGPNALVATGKLSPDIETGSTLAQAEAAKFVAGTLGGWATISNGTNNYFSNQPAPILAFNLGALEQLSDIVLWQYDDNGNGNQLHGFSMAYSTNGVNFTPFESVGSLAAGTESAQVFSLANVDSQYVKIRIDSNYHFEYPTNGGDRVGLGQVRFDGELVQSVPEPSSLRLLGLGGVIGLFWIAGRHIRDRLARRAAVATTALN